MNCRLTDFNWDESVAGLVTGDTLTLYDLLCGLMLCSGNDCGTAIAEHISGSEEAFAELMNKEAARLGATGTHFVNPHGLHDEDHYTPAYDLYLIFNAACADQSGMQEKNPILMTDQRKNPFLRRAEGVSCPEPAESCLSMTEYRGSD